MIYVDERQQSARGPWCHLNIAPGTPLEELHEFAERLGLYREEFRSHVRPELAHYILTGLQRARALSLGAVFKPAMEQAREANAAWKARGEWDLTPR